MGNGIALKCSKCKKEYSINRGVGFSFPDVYKKTLKAIKKGKYGDKLKQLSQDTELVAVDAEDHVYLCRKCGHWIVEPGLSLYAPNNPVLLMRKRYGIKPVEEWGEVPYVMDFD